MKLSYKPLILLLPLLLSISFPVFVFGQDTKISALVDGVPAATGDLFIIARAASNFKLEFSELLLEIKDNGVAETQRFALNLISGGTVTVSCVDDVGNNETDCTFTGSAHPSEINDLSVAVTWINVPDANVVGSAERDEVCNTTDLDSSCEINNNVIDETQLGPSITLATGDVFILPINAADQTTDGQMDYDSIEEVIEIGDDGVGTNKWYPGVHNNFSPTAGIDTDHGAGSIDSVADFAAALCGTAEYLVDDGGSWSCDPVVTPFSPTAGIATDHGAGSITATTDLVGTLCGTAEYLVDDGATWSCDPVVTSFTPTAGIDTDHGAGAIDTTSDLAAGLCAANQILERQGAAWACIATPGGGGNSFGIVTDGSTPATSDTGNDTLTVTDTATIDMVTGDTPEDLRANFLPAGVGAVTWLDNADRVWIFDIAAAGINPTFSFAVSSFEIDAHVTIDDEQELRLKEEDTGGENYLAFKAPAAVTSNQTCTLEDDGNFIPDSCVGDGTDNIGTDTLDDLSDDLPSALSNVTTLTNGQFCVANAGGGFDCTTAGALDDDDITDDAIAALSDVTAKTGTGTVAVFSVAPVLTGDATAVTASVNDNDTSIATTAFVQQEHDDSAGSCTNQFVTAVNTNAVPTCAGVTSADINADVIVAADVDASLDTRKAFHFIITDPDPAAVNFVFRLPPFTGTLTRIDCEAYNGTNVVINICDGEDFADDTCTTSIPGATMTCDTTGVNDTTLTNPGFVARDKMSLVIVSESGTVDRLEVYGTATID